ncbi:cilia- and flagella-associated protein 77 [Microcaecilia unicolor]|uniref:Cilia- and flagella-associated protein 77 n=1 Tax=Microcaecilia unicolor TaxID=1415580 RepID=A0A6P7YCC4_9AMPH|nr:cilia- and flagella-associated protein 77 [Microcaecilia unicolor]
MAEGMTQENTLVVKISFLAGDSFSEPTRLDRMLTLLTELLYRRALLIATQDTIGHEQPTKENISCEGHELSTRTSNPEPPVSVPGPPFRDGYSVSDLLQSDGHHGGFSLQYKALLPCLVDWLVQAPSFEEGGRATDRVLSLRRSLGWIINLEKSRLISSQSLEYLGVIFDSRAELGKTQRKCYKLPGSDFVYGQKNYKRDGGVPEAIGHWHSIEAKALRRQLPRGYIALNREAVKAGLVTVEEQDQFRKAHDIRFNPEGGRFQHRPWQPTEGMTFGISTRPSTPFFDLLEHKYRELWIKQQKQRDEVERLRYKEKIQRKLYNTRTTILRKYQPPLDPAPLWHLPHFKKVGPHLDTFANSDARQKAFSAQHTDGIARKGLNKQGIYTPC